MPHRPFTRAQARENARFLRALARTGNARLAAAELNVHRATYTKRRARNRRFATLWDAALAFAHAGLAQIHNQTRSSRAKSRGVCDDSVPLQEQACPPDRPKSSCNPLDCARDERKPRAEGGEPILVRLANGRVQLRRAPHGRMTKAAEQAFLAALAATCNVRLAAAAAGFTHSAFYQRRKKDPGFAREWCLALADGHLRLKCALIAGTLPASHEDDTWRHNDPLPIPPMSADQAIQLLCLHDKAVEHSWSKPHRRKRRGESDDSYHMRLRAMWVAEQNRAAELRLVAEAARDEPDCGPEGGEGIAALPALEQVQGWSQASPDKLAYDPGRAMFGGWRITDWNKRTR